MKQLLLCLCLLFIFHFAKAQIYVDANVGASGDGSSWAQAFKTLQEALDVAVAGNEIRMAGGMYYPSTHVGTGAASNRDWTFLIDKNLIIIGGVDPGTDAQDLENQHTILSGDIDLNGILDNGNVYHVMVTTDLTNAVVFNGLHIQGGYADGGNTNTTLSGLNVRRDRAAGVYNRGTAARPTAPLFINCIFTNNFSSDQGTVSLEQQSGTQYINCLFANNSSSTFGGVSQCLNCNTTYTNCTFFNNSAGTAAGVIARFNGTVTIHNSVFWGNNAPTQPDIQNIEATSTNNAAIPHANSNWNATSNFKALATDPFNNSADADGADDQFGTSDDGLFPGLCSPLIATGDNTKNTQTLDVTGNSRVNATNIDIGAYEYIAPATEFYVDVNAMSPGDGLSWAAAFTDLQDAICAADEGATIYVAGGIYYPTEALVLCSDCNSSRDYSFYWFFKDLTILGGYDASTGMRDLPNQETILSGDIDMNNTLDNGNTYHVLLVGDLSNQSLLDGFTITHGNANVAGQNSVGIERSFGGGLNSSQSSMIVMNCKFTDNYTLDLGGAVMNFQGSSTYENCLFINNEARRGGATANINGGVPIYRACFFLDNTATFQGGGMYNGFTSPFLYDCVFSNNNAIDPSNINATSGGAMLNAESDPRLFNCVFDHNSAGDNGGAISNIQLINTSPKPRIYNCTFFANMATFGGALHFAIGEPRLYNSVFWANVASNSGGDAYFNAGSFIASDKNAAINSEGIQGTTNFIPLIADPFRNSSDPDGVDNTWATNDDGLFPLNPAIIDVGNNAQNTEPSDVVGNDRIQDATIDIGAYEFRILNCSDFSSNIIYVNQAALGANDGSSWDNAFTNLQAALDITCSCPGVDEIWVAEGTYKPSAGVDFDNNSSIDSREYTFQICNGIKVYGGFAGGETMLNERNIALYPTILSGDVDNDGMFNNGNAYHVVYMTDVTNTTLLDGFIIQEGNANNNDQEATSIGSGIFNDGAGFNGFANPIIRNSIIKNNASSIGGGGVANFANAGGESNPTFINCAILGNNGGNAGGAIANFGDSGESSPTLINCSISGNFAQSGGGLYNSGGQLIDFPGGNSGPQVTNTIIWNNADMSGTGTADANIFNNENANPTYSHSLVQNITMDDVDGNKDGITNQADTNYPDFVILADPNTTPNMVGDLNLISTSPAIDMGDNSAISEAKDLAWNDRIFNSIVDIGAYENQCITPDGTVSSNLNTICAGELIELTFTASVGTEPFDIIVNGILYENISNGGTFATLTEGVDFIGTTMFILTQITDANTCITELENEIGVTVNNVAAGNIGSNQTICSGNAPQTLTSVSDGSGDGTITYRWEMSTTDCENGFTAIPNSDSEIYSPGALTETTYFRRVTISTLNDVVCEAISNCVTVIVNDVSAGTVAGDQTVCITKIPAPFTEVEAANGEGDISYRWEKSTTGCNGEFVAIENSNSPIYTLSEPLKETTYFRRVAISSLNGLDCEIFSNCIVVTVLKVNCGTFPWNGNE